MSTENKLLASAETPGRAKRRASVVIGASLQWRRVDTGWRLFDGRRRAGDVVPDSRHPNMWRPVLAGGRLGDMANITRAKASVFEAAVREQEWSARHGRAIDPTKCPEKRGAFEGRRSPVRSAGPEAAGVSGMSQNGSTAGAVQP